MDYEATAREVAESLAPPTGQFVLLTWETRATYKPGQPPPAATQHAHTAAGVVLDYDTREVGTQPDSLIAAGDRRLYLATLAPDLTTAVPPPPVGTRVQLVDGHATVKNCKVLAPAGVAVMFDITLAKG